MTAFFVADQWHRECRGSFKNTLRNAKPRWVVIYESTKSSRERVATV